MALPRRLVVLMAFGAALVVAGATGAPAAATRGSCAHAQTAAKATNLKAMRAAVLCLVNHQRTSRGLPALHEDARLDRAAQDWSSHMVASRDFSHGTNLGGRISAHGYNYSEAGENIATGYPTPAAVVAAWMTSRGHCHNILEPSYRAIGIGMVARPVSGYASGPATWTQDFGLRMGQRPPSHNNRPKNGCPY